MQSDCDRPAWIDAASGAARGEGGSFPPYGWTSKNCVICVCFHCHGTSSYHTTNTLQGRRAKSHVDTQTIQPRLGDFVLQTPYRPIPHLPPLLQNPGGATGRCIYRSRCNHISRPVCVAAQVLGYLRTLSQPSSTHNCTLVTSGCRVIQAV